MRGSVVVMQKGGPDKIDTVHPSHSTSDTHLVFQKGYICDGTPIRKCIYVAIVKKQTVTVLVKQAVDRLFYSACRALHSSLVIRNL